MVTSVSGPTDPGRQPGVHQSRHLGNPGARNIVAYTHKPTTFTGGPMTASTITAPRLSPAAALAVAAWLGLVLLAGATGFFVRLPFPGAQVIILGLAVATIVAGLTVPGLRAWIDGLPLRALIGFNVFRIMGFVFLAYAARELPASGVGEEHESHDAEDVEADQGAQRQAVDPGAQPGNGESRHDSGDGESQDDDLSARERQPDEEAGGAGEQDKPQPGGDSQGGRGG